MENCGIAGEQGLTVDSHHTTGVSTQDRAYVDDAIPDIGMKKASRIRRTCNYVGEDGQQCTSAVLSLGFCRKHDPKWRFSLATFRNSLATCCNMTRNGVFHLQPFEIHLQPVAK